ncbi:MAG: DinB family protein [Armatimonadetes bacterium]|nr:DinB family protein [Armatimonadota bacterium]
MNPYLVSALEMMPGLIRREFERLSPEQVDARPDPERFTPREVLAHLADWEPIFLDRIRTGVTSPGSPVPVWDESQRATDNDYASKDPSDSLAIWRKARGETVAYVRGLKPEDFAKTVEHPERGTTTVGALASMMVCHDIYHLEQLASMTPQERVADVW